MECTAGADVSSGEGAAASQKGYPHEWQAQMEKDGLGGVVHCGRLGDGGRKAEAAYRCDLLEKNWFEPFLTMMRYASPIPALSLLIQTVGQGKDGFVFTQIDVLCRYQRDFIRRAMKLAPYQITRVPVARAAPKGE